jgi:hypothetical protein
MNLDTLINQLSALPVVLPSPSIACKVILNQPLIDPESIINVVHTSFILEATQQIPGL